MFVNVGLLTFASLHVIALRNVFLSWSSADMAATGDEWRSGLQRTIAVQRL